MLLGTGLVVEIPIKDAPAPVLVPALTVKLRMMFEVKFISGGLPPMPKLEEATLVALLEIELATVPPMVLPEAFQVSDDSEVHLSIKLKMPPVLVLVELMPPIVLLFEVKLSLVRAKMA